MKSNIKGKILFSTYSYITKNGWLIMDLITNVTLREIVENADEQDKQII